MDCIQHALYGIHVGPEFYYSPPLQWTRPTMDRKQPPSQLQNCQLDPVASLEGSMPRERRLLVLLGGPLASLLWRAIDYYSQRQHWFV